MKTLFELAKEFLELALMWQSRCQIIRMRRLQVKRAITIVAAYLTNRRDATKQCRCA